MSTTKSLECNVAVAAREAQHAAVRIFERLPRGYGGWSALRLWDNPPHPSSDKSPTRRDHCARPLVRGQGVT